MYICICQKYKEYTSLEPKASCVILHNLLNSFGKSSGGGITNPADKDSINSAGCGGGALRALFDNDEGGG